MIEWQRSRFSTDQEYGYVGGLRFFVLAETRDFYAKKRWDLTINLPGPKGLIGREQGFITRIKAAERAMQALNEFAQRWPAVVREVANAESVTQAPPRA